MFHAQSENIFQDADASTGKTIILCNFDADEISTECHYTGRNLPRIDAYIEKSC